MIGLYTKAFSGLNRNVWILSLAMLINRTGSMVLLFSSLYLTNELGFSLESAGLAMTCYGIGSIVGSYAGGWLTDRTNFYDVMVVSLMSSGLFIMLILWADTLFSVCLVMFGYSVLADLFRPAMSKGIAFYSGSETRTRSVALMRLAINLGFSIAPVMAGFVAFYINYKPLYIIDGLCSIAAGIIIITLIPRKVEKVNKIDVDVQVKPKSAYTDKLYMVFILLVALYGVCFFQLFASVPKYLDQVWDYSEDEIGLFMGLNGLLVVFIEMPFIATLENQKRYFRYIVYGAFFIPMSFIALYFSMGFAVVIILYIILITFSEILAMPFMMNFALSRPAKERQGQYSALYSIAYGISNTIAPTVGLGIAGRFNFDVMLITIIVLSIIGGIGFYFLNKELEKQNYFHFEPEPIPDVISDENILDDSELKIENSKN